MVIGCQNNDRKSQQVLFEWLKDYAAVICYKYANQVTEVKDLMSDGFMKVFKNIHQYNDDKFSFAESAFKGWFKRVLINNCINYIKQHHSAIQMEDIDNQAFNEIYSSELSVIDNMNHKEIVKWVKHLPDSYKTVFCMFTMDGYSHEEIAQELGISVGTSKSNLFKARQHLKKTVSLL